MRTIHILTLNWNAEESLRRLVSSLERAVEAVEARNDWVVKWYVRDHNSKDNSLKVLESYKRDKEIFKIDHNRDSFATGVNYLRDKAVPATCDMLLLLNNDIEFRDDQGIVKMINLQKKTQADVVGCRLQYNGSTKLQHAGVIFSKRYNSLPYHFRPNEESDNNACMDRWFQAVTGACCLVREDTFRAINGLDENYRWSFEDIDMCLTIKNQGGKIAYCGGTEISHEESHSLKKNPVNKMFMGSNVEYFRKKWNGKYKLDHDNYLTNSNYLVIK